MSSTRCLAVILAMLWGSPVSFGFAADTPAGNSKGGSDAEAKSRERPVPVAEAAGRMTVPEGFKVSLFAAEPDVRQPIAFTIDPRGRLWVAESFSYPNWLQPAQEKDRVLILEDRDGDGRFDRRTVFWDRGGKVSNISGVALGFGGVWVCATPNLLFIPDRDGDDVPDGDPEVVLDGWDVKAAHNIFNGLSWGPDGWLYGCNGILSNSRVARPGTPDGERVRINCGVWRYHPTRKTFEAVAHGTTNPWGLDFDDYGEAFITNCVIPHLFRVVPGARFQRMFGQDFNAHSYGLLESCADHIHWAGGHWTDSRGGKGKHGEAGGGHAHVGAMIYLGDNWPDTYRNSVFTCNIHGHRINRDTLEASGSGYLARHAKDFLFANDDWFRGIDLKYGPDGAAFLLDWSDTGECHETDGDLAHRENGRIFKISHGVPKPATVDLARLPDDELVRLQLHKNDWYVRTARRILQERTAAGKGTEGTHLALRESFEKNGDVTRRLRALWALHATSGFTPDSLRARLDDPDEHIRNWVVRLLVDEGTADQATLGKFAQMAAKDTSPLVRLALASALQRLPVDQRLPIARGLVSHAEDARDPYLPLMNWYAIEPCVAYDKAQAAELIAESKIPIIREYLARRLVLLDDETSGGRAGAPRPGAGLLVQILEGKDDPALQKAILTGMNEALRGRRLVPKPKGWLRAQAKLARSSNEEVRNRVLRLGLIFDDANAAAHLLDALMNPLTPVDTRREALQALAENRAPGFAPTLQALIRDRDLRGAAIRGLAGYRDQSTPRILVRDYALFTPAERGDAIATLASRAEYASVLIEAIAAGAIPKRDLNPSTARQLQAFGDPKISGALEKVWGSIRPTARDKVALVAKYKAMLTPEKTKGADLSRGRLLFQRTCAQCHRLYDAGGDVGPDLTGSDRANLDYILENVLDPGALVARDYKLNTVATRDGRLVSGIIREDSEKTLVIQTVNERVIIPREEIEELKPSDASMMPEGALEPLSPDEVRDLIAYLASKSQVPLPAETPRN